jgi:putative effector of murein hydrolase
MQFPLAREMLIYYNQRLSSMIQLLTFTLSKSVMQRFHLVATNPFLVLRMLRLCHITCFW